MGNKDKTKHFLGKICNGPDNDDDFERTFLEQYKKINKFVFPNNKDMASICRRDILMKLSVPQPVAQTTRVTGRLLFSKNLSST